MKKIILLATVVPATLLASSIAHATVGGPSYIGLFSYNPADESVYYILRSEGGRGCPPELRKISLATENASTVFSCEQGEALRGNDYSVGDMSVMNKLTEMTSGYKSLVPISLPGNNIEVDVDFVRSEPLEGEPDFIIRSHFTVSVHQNGSKIDEFPITGCSAEQPFTFAGYAIPGFERKIMLLSSAKGDCWEGGYTVERLDVVGGMDGLDRTYATTQYKTPGSPLVPDEGTLVVFERDSVVSTKMQTRTPASTDKNSVWSFVFIAILGVGLGFLFGKILSKK